MTLLLYDDARARAWEPFALTRPASTLVAGTLPIHERWSRALGETAAGVLVAGHLADFDEPGQPGATAGRIAAGTVIANARFAPALRLAVRGGSAATTHRWTNAGRIAAIRLTSDIEADVFADGSRSLEDLAPSSGGDTAELDGWWADEVWDLVRLLPAMLATDITDRRAGARASASPPQAIALGDGGVYVHPKATVEPQVVFDSSGGAIFLDEGVHVHAFTRLVGPCYVGPGSTILGGDVGGSSIGPVCKVRGELSNTIFAGYANKGHDGFVGHSYLGRWVNLGAGTVTSNLKNTYGTVSLWTPGGIQDTGMQFLGTMFGDHAKTGIGLRLTTGTVLGAGANVYGSTMPPKAVPPFAWGERPPYREYHFDKFLEVAERMMARRHVELTARGRRQLAAAHAARWTVEREGSKS
jgi:UDP-N-acetylglucosamine diphosphorylase/glucosamine-1-phosphate N-acetyltransferase